MKHRLTVAGLTATVLLPFLLNLLGWNAYLYLQFGRNDLILASSLGVGHTAWADHLDVDPDIAMYLPDDFMTTLLDLGPLHVFLERRDGPMTPFTFRWIDAETDPAYRGLEFPWLLFLLIPLAVWFRSRNRANPKRCRSDQA